MVGWRIFYIHVQNIPHIGSIDFWRAFAIIQGIYINDKTLVGRKRRKMLRNESKSKPATPQASISRQEALSRETGGCWPRKRRARPAEGSPVLLQIPAGGQGDRVLPLAQLGAVRIRYQRKMAVAGNGVAEKPLQLDLARCGVEQVGPPHHLVHSRLGVVHHHGKVVGERAVRPLHHEIAALSRPGSRYSPMTPSRKVITSSGTRTRMARGLLPAGSPSRQSPG